MCAPPRNWRPSRAASQASAHEYSSSRASPSMPYFFRNRPDTILQTDEVVDTLVSAKLPLTSKLAGLLI